MEGASFRVTDAAGAVVDRGVIVEGSTAGTWAARLDCRQVDTLGYLRFWRRDGRSLGSGDYRIHPEDLSRLARLSATEVRVTSRYRNQPLH